ncbi:MAG: hypothetical protein IJ809_04535 [Clostridia bacterium]|nr:hypothetical protein [Clostridia bacterium]
MLEDKNLGGNKNGVYEKKLNEVNVYGNTLYDFIYDLVFFMSLNESKDDIKNDRVMTIEESKERLMKEYEYLDIK